MKRFFVLSLLILFALAMGGCGLTHLPTMSSTPTASLSSTPTASLSSTPTVSLSSTPTVSLSSTPTVLPSYPNFWLKRFWGAYVYYDNRVFDILVVLVTPPPTFEEWQKGRVIQYNVFQMVSGEVMQLQETDSKGFLSELATNLCQIVPNLVLGISGESQGRVQFYIPGTELYLQCQSKDQDEWRPVGGWGKG